MEEKVDRIYEHLLVLRCQTGDDAAFAELVGRYHARLRRFLRRMLDNDDHAVADALQDVWIDVFRAVGKLRDAGAFAPWLFRVARDRAYRVLRRRGVPLDVLGEMNDVAAASAEAEFDADDRRQVTQSLDRLPHAQREVLLLRFVEDLSYEQIAAAVGCELGTVRSRLHYAKRALRDLIERNGHEQHK
jgi:RNA polymerase sigma-70 factor (ECF subfamily)